MRVLVPGKPLFPRFPAALADRPILDILKILIPCGTPDKARGRPVAALTAKRNKSPIIAKKQLGHRSAWPVRRLSSRGRGVGAWRQRRCADGHTAPGRGRRKIGGSWLERNYPESRFLLVDSPERPNIRSTRPASLPRIRDAQGSDRRQCGTKKTGQGPCLSSCRFR